MTGPRYSKEEFARRGDDLYDREVAHRLGPDSVRKYVAIDIDSGDFEIDANEIVASDRLVARHPSAQIWVTRAGMRFVRQFGAQRS